MAWLEGHADEQGRTWWTVRWRDPKTGRKARRRLGPLPEDAAKAACERIAATEEGRLPRAASVTHRQALGRFLRHLRFLRRSPETVRYYDALLRPLFDELGEVAAMKRWHPGHMQEVLARHTSWSPRTVQMHLSACRRFVRWARRARVVVPDFVEDLRGPKVTVREVVAYTPAEVARILEEAEGTPLEVPVSLALLAGLSLGDLRALDWGDVTIEGVPVLILGGIYGGGFSPTEAAAVACLYAFIVSWAVMREMTLRDLLGAAASTVSFTAQILVVMACAGVFSWLITVNQVSVQLVALIEAMALPGWLLLLAINLLLLLVGCLIDPLSAILLLTPLLVPLAGAIGVDPVHFGIIVTVNLAIGLFTPPFGINLFVMQTMSGIPLKQIYRGIVPFLAIYLIALLLITYIPAISLSGVRLLIGP